MRGFYLLLEPARKKFQSYQRCGLRSEGGSSEPPKLHLDLPLHCNYCHVSRNKHRNIMALLWICKIYNHKTLEDHQSVKIELNKNLPTIWYVYCLGLFPRVLIVQTSLISRAISNFQCCEAKIGRACLVLHYTFSSPQFLFLP